MTAKTLERFYYTDYYFYRNNNLYLLHFSYHHHFDVNKVDRIVISEVDTWRGKDFLIRFFAMSVKVVMNRYMY